MKFRKKPVEIEAIRYTGSNAEEMDRFASNHFGVLDADDRANIADPEATAQIFDALHSTWVLVYDGDWIIRGVKGEMYPCRPDVFAETYEAAHDRAGRDDGEWEWGAAHGDCEHWLSDEATARRFAGRSDWRLIRRRPAGPALDAPEEGE